MGRGRPQIPLETKFWSRVSKSDGCWLWTGSVVKGYGQLSHEYKSLRAHRVSWELHNGAVPEDMCVCHTCDTPLCVNPTHLFLGSNLDNTADRHDKERDMRGTMSPHAKLTEEQVLEIRSSDEDMKQLAAKYGVKYSTIKVVKNRQNWRFL